MGVAFWTELPRENKFRFGESRDLKREIVLTHDDAGPPTANEIVTALTLDIGSDHPEYASQKCVEIDVAEGYEGSQHHTLVTARYGLPSGGVDQLAAPVDRPAIWKFGTQGATVPAFFYYHGSGNGDLRPLTNSALDYFEGVQTDEAQCKVTISENRATFPSALAIALTNTINSSSWIGGATHCWKCQGITGELRFEEWGGTVRRYWAVTAELLYRQTGWPLQLPDVGFNFLGGSPTQKRRAMVFDFENAEWVASPGPVGLDGSGAQTLGAPAILTRRVHREIDFNAYFGSPPA
jgi:hypothetical protein